MKKRFLLTSLGLAMVSTLLIGCGKTTEYRDAYVFQDYVEPELTQEQIAAQEENTEYSSGSSMTDLANSSDYDYSTLVKPTPEPRETGLQIGSLIGGSDESGEEETGALKTYIPNELLTIDNVALVDANVEQITDAGYKITSLSQDSGQFILEFDDGAFVVSANLPEDYEDLESLNDMSEKDLKKVAKQAIVSAVVIETDAVKTNSISIGSTLEDVENNLGIPTTISSADENTIYMYNVSGSNAYIRVSIGETSVNEITISLE